MAPAVLGYSSWMSPFGAQLAIRGVRTPSSAATSRGDRLEGPTLQYGADVFGWDWAPAEFRAHENGWSADSTDAIYTDRKTGKIVAIGEAKTTVDTLGWGTPGTDEMPPGVLIQCLWHMFHWPEIDVCVVPVLFGGFKFCFEHYVIHRDQAVIDEIVKRCHAWYQRHIVNAEELTPDHRDSDLLSAAYPQSRDDLLPWDEQIQADVDEKLKWQAERMAAQKNEDAAANRLRKHLGEYAGARSECGTYSITYKTAQDRVKIDADALCAKLKIPPETLSECSTTVRGSRYLRVNKKEV